MVNWDACNAPFLPDASIMAILLRSSPRRVSASVSWRPWLRVEVKQGVAQPGSGRVGAHASSAVEWTSRSTGSASILSKSVDETPAALGINQVCLNRVENAPVDQSSATGLTYLLIQSQFNQRLQVIN